MPLTDVAIRNAKPGPVTVKMSDGGGLQLWISPQGSKLWHLAYRYQGKQKKLALGAYPVVTLAAARDRRTEAKRLLAAGTDPLGATHGSVACGMPSAPRHCRNVPSSEENGTFWRPSSKNRFHPALARSAGPE